ncbi:SCO family protein [Endozoicomonadaceae bacterium StTr2]
MKKSVQLTVFALVGIIALVVGLTFYRTIYKPPMSTEQLRQSGTVVFDAARSFETGKLLKHTGEEFDQNDFNGKWSLLYFGYTFCPDICPVSLTKMNQFHKLLAEKDPELAEKIKVYMVTVDPQRDTVEQMGQYMPYFNPEFVGLTGEMKYLYNFARQLNVPFSPVAQQSDEFYLVDHSANIFVVNPKGDYHGFIRPPLDAAKMLNVMKTLDRNFD